MATSHTETRVELLLGAPLASDAIRRWPQSGNLPISGRTTLGLMNFGPGVKNFRGQPTKG